MNRSVQLKGVSRSVGGEAHLVNVSMTLEPGTFTTVLGRTRAGKTSLLRVLAGLDHADTGSVHADGRDVTRRGVRQRDVAMVYQQFINYPSLTVYENIAAPLRNRGRMRGADLDERVRETARAPQIEELLPRLPAQLSGGQQQRTAIARALARRAGLILLDEPLANLDYKLREELRGELKVLLEGTHAIVVYTTAEPTEAMLLGGETLVLDRGRVLQKGPPRAIYDAPANVRVSQIFSDPEVNLWDAEVRTDGHVDLSGTVRFPASDALAVLAPGRYRFAVRPHHVTHMPESEQAVRLPAKVQLQEVTGSDTILHAVCGALRITAQAARVLRHAPGADVPLFVEPRRFLVFRLNGSSVPCPASPPRPIAPTEGTVSDGAH